MFMLIIERPILNMADCVDVSRAAGKIQCSLVKMDTCANHKEKERAVASIRQIREKAGGP